MKKNKTLKIIVSISIIVLILLTIGGVVYHYSFPLVSDLENVEECINEWIHRGVEEGEIRDIQIYDPIIINNLMYYPIEVDDSVGYILLKEGLTNRYKIDHSRGTSGSFLSEVISSNGEKYIVLIGRNDNLQIDKVEMDPNEVKINWLHIPKPAEFNVYELDIPKQDVFAVFVKVDERIPEGAVRVSKILNKNGDDITSSIESEESGGVSA